MNLRRWSRVFLEFIAGAKHIVSVGMTMHLWEFLERNKLFHHSTLRVTNVLEARSWSVNNDNIVKNKFDAHQMTHKDKVSIFAFAPTTVRQNQPTLECNATRCHFRYCFLNCTAIALPRMEMVTLNQASSSSTTTAQFNLILDIYRAKAKEDNYQ